MALNPKYTNLAVNTKAEAQGALADAGKLRVYDGTQPATADTAITTQNLLVELTMNATAFGAGVSGVVTANAITDGTAVFTATATWFRLLKSDGTTAICDGSAGAAGSNLNLTPATIVSGATVSVTAFTMTEQKG